VERKRGQQRDNPVRNEMRDFSYSFVFARDRATNPVQTTPDALDVTALDQIIQEVCIEASVCYLLPPHLSLLGKELE